MSELYAERMRGPDPDEADQWVLEIAEVMRAKRHRHTRRHERILHALREGVPTTMDDHEVFV